MKFHLIKTMNGFKLAYDSDLEKSKKLKVGDIVECDIKKPRNYEFHKKFFALIEMVFQNQERFDDKEVLRAYLTMKSGYSKVIPTGEGIMYLPKSISFASMDELEFEALFNKFLGSVVDFIGVDETTVIGELQEFM